MRVKQMLVFVLYLLIAKFHWNECFMTKKFTFSMPNVYPDKEESYFCTSARVVPDKNFYIVGFEPNATMDVVHHMILFGCSEPGSKHPYWNCGEMSFSGASSPCRAGSSILYAWAMNAKPLLLPKDVGFQIGKSTGVDYLVLQIHYGMKFVGNKRDNSGLRLVYTQKPQSKLAGVFLMGTDGVIPPRSITHMETACDFDEPKVIHPFAYRTHTHSLGKVVAGYAVRRDQNGVDHWSLLGRRNPNTPQMFYPVFDTSPVKMGERLAARCTMDSSNRTQETRVGSTHEMEMCNFYLMYFVENDKPLSSKYCMTRGPPYYYWRNEENDFNHIPDIEASTLD